MKETILSDSKTTCENIRTTAKTLKMLTREITPTIK